MEGDLIPCSEEPINPYLKFANHTTIPTGYIWLRGDNSKTSHDSRFYGPVSQALVQGRVIYQIRPIFKKIESGL
ncbi:IMMP1L [Bugula neritina]|uniref:IMMP1L n=1 Tax=Bugula neritina TaxID=10212 RepID=A0A7J7J2Y6_BUGNE|nr:IMMP1L [Bugula neritina]